MEDRDRQALAISLIMSDQRTAVDCAISVEFMAARQCLLGLISNHAVVIGEPLAINKQPSKIGIEYLNLAMQKVPTGRFR